MKKVINTLNRYYQKKSQNCVVFSPEAIEKGVQYIMKCENNIDHIFKAEKHQLNLLMNRYGNWENVTRDIIKSLNGKLYENELFKCVIHIDNYKICVKGRVMNKIPKIGTMYIPWDKK